MKKLTKDHIIEGQVYPAGTEYSIGRSINEGIDKWPALSNREWETMDASTLQDYLDSNDVNSIDRDGMTPLMFASEYNSNPQVIQSLIDNGADIYAENHLGRTALMIASAFSSEPKAIEVFIKNGLNIHQRVNGPYKYTSLMLAAMHNISTEVIQVLIDNGADVNATFIDTVLELAMENNPSAAVIQHLIDNGAKE